MPHLLVQTRFPAAAPRAEVTFYGSFERELLTELQTVTVEAVEALQATYGLETQSAGSWKPSPISPNAIHCVIDLPDTREHRALLENILQVAWLDVCEKAGWASVCAWGATTPCPCPVSGTGMEESARRSSGAFDGEGTNFLLYKYSATAPEQPPTTSTPVEERTAEPMEEDDHRSQSENLDSPSSQGGQGLPLPEVVMQLVKDPTILQWDAGQRCYIVIDGERFEEKFNQMRKMRQKKAKPSAAEHSRPFSRMHNFFILDRGDKWAKTGTSFRPKSSKFAPPGYQHASPALTAQGTPPLHSAPVPLFLRHTSHVQTLLASPLLRAAEGLERDTPPDTAGMDLLSGLCSTALASVGVQHRTTNFTNSSSSASFAGFAPRHSGDLDLAGKLMASLSENAENSFAPSEISDPTGNSDPAGNPAEFPAVPGTGGRDFPAESPESGESAASSSATIEDLDRVVDQIESRGAAVAPEPGLAIAAGGGEAGFA
mmetsp:Transcript_67022/g.153839  ORF Transcript_67022/g.153839 Transcript_67022/m.153839 type:complete len:487 (+) Transcript_67022:93-1553(+)